MGTYFDIHFLFSFLYFWFVVFVAWYIPGDLLLRHATLSRISRITLATVLGMVLWGWQGFIFGYFGLRFLTYVYVAITCLLWVRTRRVISLRFSLRGVDWGTIGIVALGMALQLLPMIANGFMIPTGLYLCCGNQFDNIYYLTLTRSIVDTMPPLEPGLSGMSLVNYHYWSNLVLAELIRVFRLPLFATVFQFSSIFLTLCLGLGAVAFSKVLGLQKQVTRWLLFFLYFAGDAIYMLLLFLGRIHALPLVSALEDSMGFLVNPPRAFSLVVAVCGLAMFALWRKERRVTMGIISMIILSSTVGFKVYTALFLACGLAALGLYWLAKRQWKDVGVVALFYLLAMGIYLPTNAASGGLFWAPLEIVHNFIVQSAFGLERTELARYVYIAHNNYLRIFQYEIMYVAVFLLTLVGTKIVGIMQSIRSFMTYGKELAILLSVGLVANVFVGLFFYQTSGGSNTFNFLVSFWFFLSFFAALGAAYWQQRLGRLRYVFVCIIILLTIPRLVLNVWTLTKSFIKHDYLVITHSELAGYRFIEEQTPKTSRIAVDPNLGVDQETPILSAFTGRHMFMSGKQILESHAIAVDKKEIQLKRIFEQRDPVTIAHALIDENIDYLYFYKDGVLRATESALFTSVVFQNEDAMILRVDSEKTKEFISSKETYE